MCHGASAVQVNTLLSLSHMPIQIFSGIQLVYQLLQMPITHMHLALQ